MQFTITDMTCGGCVRSVTAAIRGVDADATVQADLDTHLVQVTTTAPRATLVAALEDAGYSPA
jgi:copper chaperone